MNFRVYFLNFRRETFFSEVLFQFFRFLFVKNIFKRNFFNEKKSEKSNISRFRSLRLITIIIYKEFGAKLNERINE